MPQVHLREFEKVATNLWKRSSMFYRLYGDGVTPNGCWRINPRMVGLIDIDVSTGEDVLSDEIIELDMGTVPAGHLCCQGAEK